MQSVQCKFSLVITPGRADPQLHLCPKTPTHMPHTPLTRLLQILFPLHNFRLKFDQENCFPRPQLSHLAGTRAMRRNSCWEARPITTALHNPSNESSTVQLAHLLRYADILVDQRLVIRDHILVRRLRIAGFLQRIGLPREEVLPQNSCDELEERYNVEGAGLRARGFAVEEQVEELQADGVALGI
jgi:hypothetical protein